MPELRLGAITAFFIAGIIAAAYGTALAWVLIATGIFVVAMLLFPHRKLIIGIALLFFLIGVGRYLVSRQVSANDISLFATRTSAVEGYVAEDPEGRDDRVQLVLNARHAKISNRWRDISGRVMVTVYAQGSELPLQPQYGDRIRISVTPYTPTPPTNPGQFSWRDYLARRGIYTCASVRRPDQLQVMNGGSGNSFVSAAVRAKHYMAECIGKLHPERESALISGIVLGTYAYLPRDILNHFSSTGTLHILAASGYNCYILGVCATALLRFLRFPRHFRPPVVLALIAFYLFIVGTKPSLLRASIMAAIFLLATPLGRVANIRNTLFAAAFIILMINPSHLFDPGFQLSFLAVWALVSVGPVLNNIVAARGLLGSADFKSRSGIRRLAGKALAYTVAAGIGTTAISLVTAPLVAYHINYVSLTAIPANMVIAAGVPLLFIDGFASNIVAHFPCLEPTAGCVGSLVARGILTVVGCLGSIGSSSICVAQPNVGMLVGYYVLLYAATSWAGARYAQR